MKPPSCLPQAFHSNIPLFLAPAFAECTISSNTTRPFSTSRPCHRLRNGRRDLSRNRGESVLRSTGPRSKLDAQRLYKELPKPETEEARAEKLKEFKTNPNHGLYGFFNEERETVLPGDREEQHGRAWAVSELTFKSFEDLHATYWKGLLELNRVKTRHLEHKRLRLGFGVGELRQRITTINKTLSNIRYVLRTRQEAWLEASIIKEKTQTMEELRRWLDQRGLDQTDSDSALVSAATDPTLVSSIPDVGPTMTSGTLDSQSNIPIDLRAGPKSQPQPRV